MKLSDLTSADAVKAAALKNPAVRAEWDRTAMAREVASRVVRYRVDHDLSQAQLDSPLGRTSPVVKLAVAIAWLVALAFTLEPLPPVAVAVLALGAGMWLGQIPIPDLARALAPLWLAALGIGLFNTLFSPANLDPSAAELITIGPFRITEPALLGGVSLALRVIAIATVGAVFALTTDSTKLVDSLVQQARFPERFAYGTLAAYQAIPRFAEDLTTLRQARRIRGLGGGWHPRLLVSLLVLAIRHGDRKALAMDARAFGSVPRSAYRVALSCPSSLRAARAFSFCAVARPGAWSPMALVASRRWWRRRPSWPPASPAASRSRRSSRSWMDAASSPRRSSSMCIRRSTRRRSSSCVRSSRTFRPAPRPIR